MDHFTILSYVLTPATVLLTFGFVTFLAYGCYQLFLSPVVTDVRLQDTGMGGVGSVAVRRLGSFNRQLMWPSFEISMRKKLIKAGEPRNFTPEDILALQELGAVGGLVFGLIVARGTGQSLAWCLPAAALGAFLPQIWLNDQIKKRQQLISRALPYNLDLLTLSVEAGLDFAAALAKVVEKGKPGPLREELSLVLKQLKMGKTREEALRTLVARVDLPSLTSFVSALIQADRMGTSIGKVLRIQSTQMRIDRSLRAEKAANEAPVKMLFPLIACIFPTVFLILFGPIVFAMMFGDYMG